MDIEEIVSLKLPVFLEPRSLDVLICKFEEPASSRVGIIRGRVADALKRVCEAEGLEFDKVLVSQLPWGFLTQRYGGHAFVKTPGYCVTVRGKLSGRVLAQIADVLLLRTCTDEYIRKIIT